METNHYSRELKTGLSYSGMARYYGERELRSRDGQKYVNARTKGMHVPIVDVLRQFGLPVQNLRSGGVYTYTLVAETRFIAHKYKSHTHQIV